MAGTLVHRRRLPLGNFLDKTGSICTEPQLFAVEADFGFLNAFGSRLEDDRTGFAGLAPDNRQAKSIEGATLQGLERLVAGSVAVADRHNPPRSGDFELYHVVRAWNRQSIFVGNCNRNERQIMTIGTDFRTVGFGEHLGGARRWS